MMRLRLFIIGMMSIFFESCHVYITGLNLWNYNKTDPSKFDSTQVNFRTDGYYKMKTDEVNIYWPYSVLIFYKNGYFASAYTLDYLKTYSKEEIKGKRILNWGRYSCEEGKVFIQYVWHNDIPSLILPLPTMHWSFLTNMEGKVLNDTTLWFNRCRHEEDGIFEEEDIERLYFFQKYDSLPPSDNWLMEEFKEK